MKTILEKFWIVKPYVLYVGVAYPHKNLPRLLEAWKLFCDRYGDGYQLVLAGKENYFYRKLFGTSAHQHISTSARETNVVYTGWVPDEELEVLYAGARLHVFPSLYEGFGLPPLEAMARGVPVVSSNRTCLPEVLGEAALYVDPESIEDMAGAIHRGLTNEDLRSTLRENAKRELARYSWKALAFRTIGVYETLLPR